MLPYLLPLAYVDESLLFGALVNETLWLINALCVTALALAPVACYYAAWAWATRPLLAQRDTRFATPAYDAWMAPLAFLSVEAARVAPWPLCLCLLGSGIVFLYDLLVPAPVHLGNGLRLVGISGKVGSGKTTLARLLCKRHPQFEQRSFAEKLRQALSLLTGVPAKKTRSVDDKNLRLEAWDATVGQLLQRLGTEVGRVLHPDAWVMALFADWGEHAHWVIDDVRFPNEADAIKARGGLLVRLVGRHDEKDARDREHVSETALDDYAFERVIDTERLTPDEVYATLFPK